MSSRQQEGPEWVTRGKTIRQLIQELRSFENQDLEVRLSLDDGDTHAAISLVAKIDDTYCVLMNSASKFALAPAGASDQEPGPSDAWGDLGPRERV